MPADPQAMEDAARAYLRAQLGERAPRRLVRVAQFDEAPLAGEGPAAAFAFTLPRSPDDSIPPHDPPTPAGPARAAPREVPHFVVAGRTAPNYYPDYGLTTDELYSLHIGTRFLLELGGARTGPAEEPPAARAAMREFVARCNPDVPIQRDELAGLFRCADRRFAVYRVTLGGQDVYCLGADCPPGFQPRADRPPQVALRLHLGQLIRAEARRAALGDPDSDEGST